MMRWPAQDEEAESGRNFLHMQLSTTDRQRRSSNWILFSILLTAFSLTVISCGTIGTGGTSGRNVSVRGHMRSNGSYVQPHMRSGPDGAFFNNWSSKGNVNPYTGKPGTLTGQSGAAFYRYNTGTSGNAVLTPQVGNSNPQPVSNPVEKFKATRQAALNGNPAAQNNLGLMYRNGDGVRADFTEAAKWFRKAMESGDLYGLSNLGKMYLNGHGVEQDFCHGYRLINNAAERGHSPAIKTRSSIQSNIEASYLAILLRFPTFKELRDAANSGDADAEYVLGRSYFDGMNNLKNDFKESIKWSRKAASKGNASAQILVGSHYEYGLGIGTNKIVALEWYSKAAEQRSVRAYQALGNLFYHGTNAFPNSYAQAVKWYRMGADAGDAWGQAYLGDCYYNGEGVEKDFNMASQLFLKAAEQGNPWAQCNIGYCFQMGEGVAKDISQAIKWYRLAAGQGDGMAQNNLGECYRDGEGVLQSYVEAYKWFNLSAAQGIEDAIKQRKELVPKMTKEQIAEGQRLSEQFLLK